MSPSFRRAKRFAAVAVVGGFLLLVLPTHAPAQEQEPLLRLGVVQYEGSDWREALAYRVGEGDTYWWTSNAEHTAGGDEPAAFGQAWVWSLGATAAHGCLFSETDDGPVLAWTFFQAWDPGRGELFSWQSNASGTFGVGWERPVPVGHTSEMEQTFVARDGTRTRLRHETDYVHADTMVTRSFDWDAAAEDWTLRRTYTWVRRGGDPERLCPGIGPD